MTLDNLMLGTDQPTYYTQAFRNLLEDHMSILRAHPTTEVVTVEPGIAYRFESDFFGLLRFFNLPHHLHWVTMRMNNLTSELDSPADLTAIYIPRSDTLEQLRSAFNTTNKVS